jgi:hypothetical protein
LERICQQILKAKKIWKAKMSIDIKIRVLLRAEIIFMKKKKGFFGVFLLLIMQCLLICLILCIYCNFSKSGEDDRHQQRSNADGEKVIQWNSLNGSEGVDELLKGSGEDNEQYIMLTYRKGKNSKYDFLFVFGVVG